MLAACSRQLKYSCLSGSGTTPARSDGHLSVPPLSQQNLLGASLEVVNRVEVCPLEFLIGLGPFAMHLSAVLSSLVREAGQVRRNAG